MTEGSDCSATIRLVRATGTDAERMLRALGPEAHREVPRATARLSRPADRVVEITVTARDSGALRAALNTYLGWVSLFATTEASLPSG